MTQTLDTRALNMLEARLVEEHNRRAEIVLRGTPTDMAEYREYIGFLRALSWVKEECVQVEKDLYGKPDPKKS